jgi:hypothetical protein
VAISPATEETRPSPASATTEQSTTSSIHAISRTCPGECGMCSVSYTRRPRPREQSALSFAAQPRLPPVRPFSPGDNQQTSTLSAKCLQLQPRAPPASRA